MIRSQALVYLFLLVALVLASTSASAQLAATGISPNPMRIGQNVVLEGSGFGARDSMEIQLVRGDRRGAIAQIRGGQIRSWTDTRIELAPLPVPGEGRYYLDLLRRSAPAEGRGLGPDLSAGLAFEAVLPAASIASIGPGRACPGDVLRIRGSNFTDLRGVFMILWVKVGEDRPYTVSITNDRIVRWSNSEIQIRIPADLPAYVSPGTRYRIILAADDEVVRTVARSPIAELPDDCGSTAAPGTGPNARNRAELEFRVAPMKNTGQVSDILVFGGTFVAGTSLGDRLPRQSAQVEWKITRDGGFVKGAILDVRKRRTPFLQRVTANQSGAYRLELRLLSGPEMIFQPNLQGARVLVTDVTKKRVHPDQIKRKPKRRTPLPKQPIKNMPELPPSGP
ncbi:MAG: hypothetical protein GY937_04660 [bacterium]|nr:hypothetical protein [bacterium]